jgi:Mce-associated membrane protein
MAVNVGAPTRIMKKQEITTVTDTEIAEDASAADAELDQLVDATEEARIGDEYDTTTTAETSSKTVMSTVRFATLIGLVTIVGLAGLAGWLGYRTHASRQAQDQRNLFLQVGRQGALNLTTIDWQHADTDIRRILDGATGTFYDDFAKRSQPFVDVIKQTKSTTVGTITEAGLESDAPRAAQVLVTVSVKTSNAVASEQDPRYWRMRISVQEVGDQAKVSNVEFVP